MLLRHLLGTALRRLRLRQGRTLRDVARTARVSVPYLSEIERGRKEASSEILGAVCVALDVSLRTLLDEALADIVPAPAPSPDTEVPLEVPVQVPDDLSALLSQQPWLDGGLDIHDRVPVG
jgi:transcriptional regulator with XRE-family HTH domain